MNPTNLPDIKPVVTVTVPLTAYEMSNRNTFGSVIQDESNVMYFEIVQCFMDIIGKMLVVTGATAADVLTRRVEPVDEIANDAAELFGDIIPGDSTSGAPAVIHTPIEGSTVLLQYFKSPRSEGYTIRVYNVDIDDILSCADKYQQTHPKARGLYGANYHNERKKRGMPAADSSIYKSITFAEAFGAPIGEEREGMGALPDTLDDIVDSRIFKVPLSAVHSKCFMRLAFPWENVNNAFEDAASKLLRRMGVNKGMALRDDVFDANMPAEIMAALNPPDEENEDEEEESGEFDPYKSKKRKRKYDASSNKKRRVEEALGLFPYNKNNDPNIMVLRDTCYLHQKINEDIFENEYKTRPLKEYQTRLNELNDAYWESPRVHKEMSNAVKSLVAYKRSMTTNVVEYQIPIFSKKYSILGNTMRNFYSYTKYALRLEPQNADFQVCWLGALNVYNATRGMHFHMSMSGDAGVGKSHMYNMLTKCLIEGTYKQHTIQGSSRADFTENADSYVISIYPEAPYFFYKDANTLQGKDSETHECMKEMLTSSETTYEYMYFADKEGKSGSSGAGDRKVATIKTRIHRCVFTAQNKSIDGTSSALKDRFFKREMGKRSDDLTARQMQFLASIDENSPDKNILALIFGGMTKQTQYIAAKFLFFVNSKCSTTGFSGIASTLLITFLLNRMKSRGINCESARDSTRTSIIAESLTIMNIINSLFYVKGSKYHGRDIAKEDITSDVLREMEKRAIVGVEETIMAINFTSPQWFNIVDRDIILSIRNSMFKVNVLETPTSQGLTDDEFLVQYHTFINMAKGENPSFNIYPCFFKTHSDDISENTVASGLKKTRNTGGANDINFNTEYDGESLMSQGLWVDPNYIVIKYDRFADCLRAITQGFDAKPPQEAVKSRLLALFDTPIWPKKYYKPTSEHDYTKAMQTMKRTRNYRDWSFEQFEACPREGVTIAKNLTPPNEKGYYKIAFSIDYLERHNGFNVLHEIIQYEFPHVGMHPRTIPLINYDTQKLEDVILVPPTEPKDFSVKNPLTYDAEAREWVDYHKKTFKHVKSNNTNEEMAALITKWISAKEITIDKDLDEVAQEIHWNALGLSREERDELLSEKEKLYEFNEENCCSAKVQDAMEFIEPLDVDEIMYE